MASSLPVLCTVHIHRMSPHLPSPGPFFDPPRASPDAGPPHDRRRPGGRRDRRDGHRRLERRRRRAAPSATESAVHSVEAIVRGYVDPGAERDEPGPRRGARPGDRRPARAADPVRRDPPDQHLVARRPDRLLERARAARPAVLHRPADRQRLRRRRRRPLRRRRRDEREPAVRAARATACRRCPAAISSCSSRSGAPWTAIRSASTTSTRTPA